MTEVFLYAPDTMSLNLIHNTSQRCCCCFFYIYMVNTRLEFEITSTG